MGRMSEIQDARVFATRMNRHCRDTNGTSNFFHLFERSAAYATSILEIPLTNHKNVPFEKSGTRADELTVPRILHSK